MELVLLTLLFLGTLALLLGLREILSGTGAKEERDFSPYRLRSALLTPAERSFWGVLQRVVPSEHLIWPKVRLVDLLLVEGEGGKRLSAFNQVRAKHVDFVVVRAKDTRPILAIELDDSSHQRPDRQERDRFIDELMQKVGLPLVRIQARHAYAPEALKALLAPHLEADGASSNDPLRPR